MRVRARAPNACLDFYAVGVFVKNGRVTGNLCRDDRSWTRGFNVKLSNDGTFIVSYRDQRIEFNLPKEGTSNDKRK